MGKYWVWSFLRLDQMIGHIQDKNLRNKSYMATVDFSAGSKILQSLYMWALNSLIGANIKGLGKLTKELGQFKISCLLARKLNMFCRGQLQETWFFSYWKGIITLVCVSNYYQKLFTVSFYVAMWIQQEHCWGQQWRSTFRGFAGREAYS